ncbi:MAG: lysoplasmalogenase [Pseudomonadota bacterium]
MTQADRYEDDEPLIPEWAAGVYFTVGLIVAAVYLGIDLFTASMPGMAALKALGIVLLGVYALLKKAPVLALALLLSAAGDYALALGENALVYGIGFFASAHLVYLAIFLSRIASGGLRRDGFILAAVLIAYGLAMLWWLQPGMGALAGPASAYVGVIVLMAIAAALVNGSRLILIGALFFVVSDSILAARWFQGAFDFGFPDWGGAMVWITYVAAQALLARGIAEHPAPPRP